MQLEARLRKVEESVGMDNNLWAVFSVKSGQNKEKTIEKLKQEYLQNGNPPFSHCVITGGNKNKFVYTFTAK
jgi:hypothetical protein